MSQPIKVDFFNCTNIFLVVVLVRLPVLWCWFKLHFFKVVFHLKMRLFSIFKKLRSSSSVLLEVVFHFLGHLPFFLESSSNTIGSHFIITRKHRPIQSLIVSRFHCQPPPHDLNHIIECSSVLKHARWCRYADFFQIISAKLYFDSVVASYLGNTETGGADKHLE